MLNRLLKLRILPAALMMMVIPQGLSSVVDQRSVAGGQLILQDIPEIPAELSATLARYHNTRATGFAGWQQDGKQILVKTRFNGTSQLHSVTKPGSRPVQLTAGDEPVGQVAMQPGGSLVAFTMNKGGSGFDQIHLLDPKSGETRRLTDGVSLNNRIIWDHSGTRLAYRSTRRNGRSNDIWIMHIDAPDEAFMALKASDGALWKPVDFSHDGQYLLVQQYGGITDSSVYLLNLQSGKLKLLVGNADQESSNIAAAFSHDNLGAVFVSNQRGEIAEVGWVSLEDPAKKRFIKEALPWDVTEFELSEDGKRGAFVINEEGISRLYLFDPGRMRSRRVRNTPVGVISNLNFSPDGRRLGLTMNTARTPSDAFVLKLGRGALYYGKLSRWTFGDVGGLNANRFVQPELVHFPAPMITDDKILRMPAFVYKPRGRGPFPVVVYIHGGPEGQYRPSFNSIVQMWVQELGIAVIAPNVRGSLGYGQDYLRMDDGIYREHAVRDIGALLDWIATEEEFDESRVAVYGGSYGGYMALASAVHYSDRIKAAVDQAGISNFVTYLENTQDYRRDLRRVEYGDERDPEMRAFLENVSPLNNVDKIQTPLFIAQGQNDPVVPVTESEQMVGALRERGLPVWYLNAMHEGHVFLKKETRDTFQQVTFMFLQEYLLD